MKIDHVVQIVFVFE